MQALLCRNFLSPPRTLTFYIGEDDDVAIRARLDLVFIVHTQLPPGIRDQVTVDVETDAYFLEPIATITDARGRAYKCKLIDEMHEGMPLRCKLPDEFIAQLCAVV
jgi:hypothetical protein